MSYYHGNFNISVMNKYFILKIPGWKLQIFQNIRIYIFIFYFLFLFIYFIFFWHKFFVLWKSLLWRCFNLSENKRIGVGSCNDTVGISLWFASWGQTSYFFLDWSFPSFQLPYKFPWALHKHGKTKFLHVLRFSNKYAMATFYLCNVVTL